MTQTRVIVPGSEILNARAPAGAKVDDGTRIEVTVVLRRRTPLPVDASPAAIDRAVLPKDRHVPTRASFAEAHGADAGDIAKVEEFAHDHGLTVVEVSPARRSVILSGTAAALNAAFGVTLTQVGPAGAAQAHAYQGSLTIPTELGKVVSAVLGLDSRKLASPHFRVRPADRATASSFDPPELARLYDFPAAGDGSGQTIAFIELGGGYHASELKRYFKQLGLKAPSVTAISVDGGHNAPTNDPNGADGEVALDVEVAGAVAPGARLAVYFAPNTDRGFVDALTTAVHDAVRKPHVVSISWGSAEANWSSQAIQAFEAALQDAAALGVTVCVASGDDGSSDSMDDGQAHVDFPASSPFALACGGTKLEAAGGAITSEVVWNNGAGNGAGGGGISDVFPLPAWQANAGVPASVNGGHKGRGVPDVSGDADPNSGYNVLVDGTSTVIGGTSAVAPLWAGLLARINQLLGKPVGYLNPILYANLGGAQRDIVTGSNGKYEAQSGWDCCTGFGSPDGAKLLALLRGN